MCETGSDTNTNTLVNLYVVILPIRARDKKALIKR